MIEKYIQLDKRRNQTISKQLEISLYSVIMTKSFPDLYILPSPSDLALALQISEEDVHVAYQSLVKANILEYLNNEYSIKKNIIPTASNYVLRAIVESIRSIGLEPAIKPIEQVTLTAQSLKKVVNDFDKDDHLLSVKRVYTGNEHPVAYLDELLSLKYLKGMDKLDLSQFLFYPYIFETYKDDYKIVREFTIDSMPKDIALKLNQNEGIPAIHTISKSYNSGGHLVELSDIWSVADYFRFKAEVDL